MGFLEKFPISRDPPEGGTVASQKHEVELTINGFPISRDPPEGGTIPIRIKDLDIEVFGFQFLGIPPKGELPKEVGMAQLTNRSFQFLGIPPKGERTPPASWLRP